LTVHLDIILVNNQLDALFQRCQMCKSVQYFLSYSGFKSRPSFSITLYYGATVVYAVRRWPKRRYAAHTCTSVSNTRMLPSGNEKFCSKAKDSLRSHVLSFSSTLFSTAFIHKKSILNACSSETSVIVNKTTTCQPRKEYQNVYNAEILRSQCIFLLAITQTSEMSFVCTTGNFSPVLFSGFQLSSFIAGFPPFCYFTPHSGNSISTFNHAVTHDLYIFIYIYIYTYQIFLAVSWRVRKIRKSDY
jgi:hypothetical protein